ncbi:MAG TPA: aldehyde dehydrogenase family protein, partial [Chromatiales bacterium]|nr:aldehyde dehydrogenase family protein [Chromatiales bacterium]
MRAEIEVRNPRTGQVDYRVTPPDSHQLRAIASELRAAQPEWLARGVEGRCEVIRNWSQSLVGAPDALIDALSHDTGRYLLAFAELMALPGMVDRWCKIAPVLLDTAGERESVSPGVGIRDQLVPYELVGIISPWNFPLLLSMIDAVPALVAGCAVLVKPSEVTLRFIEPMMASIRQFPELASVFRFVAGDGQTGAELIENVDAVAFTGSVKTGRIVAEACAKRFIPSFLELGGKDPCIVLPSADMSDAARIVLRSSVQATGQACQSLERIYVPREHFDEFVGELVRQAEALELNYPDIHKGQIGPLIFDRQAEVIEEQLQDAVAKGARIL